MSHSLKIGIIGGSGLSETEIESQSLLINTPFGKTSSAYEIKFIEDREAIFLRRHGESHSIPPHKVNYRANIYGFKQLNVDRILGIFAVGSLNENIPPGTIVIPEQLIDFTQGMREHTFYDGPQVVHIDFTNPFCEELRFFMIEAANKLGINILNTGTYVCINGPRLETAAEIKFYQKIGGDIIGMTLMPEASLARELCICYSAVAVVVNYAAGISKYFLTVKEIVETMRDYLDVVGQLIQETIKILPSQRSCICKDALKDACF